MAWNVFYMLLHVARNIIKDLPIESLPKMAYNFVFFNYNGFMWFFVPLILIYLSMPFVAQFILNSERRLLRTFLLLSMLLSPFPPLDPGFTDRHALGDVYLMGSKFIFFVVAGYYFGNYDIRRQTRRMIYALAVASVAVMFIGTMLLTLNAPTHYKYFLSYTNIPCTLTAIAVFLLFKYTDWAWAMKRLRLAPEQLASYSGLSLGIYLVQMAWFTVLGHLHICDNHIILKFIVMYTLCAASVMAMRRMPIVKRLVP